MKFDATVNAQNIARIIACSAFVPEVVRVELVGTMYTHGEGNDYDYVVLVPDVEDDKVAFSGAGYTATGQVSGTEDEFCTFRRQDVNIMLTDSASFALDFKRAAEVTKYVQGLIMRGQSFLDGGLDKEQRIKIHRIIMNEEAAE